MPTALLFVYGTLCSAADNSPARLLRARATCLGHGTFSGRLYEIAGYPGAVLSDDPHDLVHGELWQIIGDPDLLFKELDSYEECTPAFPTPHEYQRRCIRVTLEDGRQFNAWTWLYNRPIEKLKQIPSGDYMKDRDA